MDDLPRLPAHEEARPSLHRRNMPQRSNSTDSHTRTECRSVRTATRSDLPFIDQLQKKFSNNVGFLPGPALVAYVDRFSVLIALDSNTQVGYLLGRPALHWQPLLRPIYQLCVEPIAQGHHHAIGLITAWQNLAKLSGQVGVQANCANHIPANTFWPAQGYKFICHLTPTNARSRDIIVWRKPLARALPRWFIDAPHRAGYRGRKTGATK